MCRASRGVNAAPTTTGKKKMGHNTESRSRTKEGKAKEPEEERKTNQNFVITILIPHIIF